MRLMHALNRGSEVKQHSFSKMAAPNRQCVQCLHAQCGTEYRNTFWQAYLRLRMRNANSSGKHLYVRKVAAQLNRCTGLLLLHSTIVHTKSELEGCCFPSM